MEYWISNFYINMITYVDVMVDSTDQTQGVYFRGLLRVTFWKFVSSWGLLFVHSRFTRGLLLESSLNIDMWSKRVLYIIIVLPVIPIPCIFQIHMSRLSQGSTFDRDLLFGFWFTLVDTWLRLGLLHVRLGLIGTVMPHITLEHLNFQSDKCGGITIITRAVHFVFLS